MMLTDLNFIATILEGLEETIIARMIDRAQYLYNEIVYLPGQAARTRFQRGCAQVQGFR